MHDSLLGLFLILSVSCGSVWAQQTFQYPESRRDNVVDDFHGTPVSDPYRWLEEDVRTSEEVADWVAAQNEVTHAFLAQIPSRSTYVERLKKLWNYPRFGLPRRVGDKYIWTKNDGLQDQSVLYIASDPTADGDVLLDPNTWSEDGTVALVGTSTNDQGTLMAYKRSEAGSDWQTIHLLDLETGEQLSDRLKWVRFSAIEWNKDGTGFYYNRYPTPESDEKHQQIALNQMVCFHRVGTDQSEDEVVYRREDHPDWHFWIGPTEDDAYLLLMIEKSTDAKNQLLYRPQDAESNEWIPLIEDFDNQFTPVGNDGSRLLLLTDYESPSRRIVAMDVNRPGRTELIEIVPQRHATLESAGVVGNRLITEYLEDVTTQVRIHQLTGELERVVELPGVGTAGGFAGKPEDQETFYAFTSLNTPASIYRYDMATGDSTQIRGPEVDFDPDQFVVKQVFYQSKDGTKIPMFVAHHRDIEYDGRNPTLLYGYGGFSISLTPSFSASRIAWMESGGVFAMANLRGGGEYGEKWHLAGKLEQKQNVFDDFIAAAEWLIAENITASQHLAIQGGSNGGLLVGAVMCQRPDLFAACLPAVGVMDMLRFHQFTAGRFWTAEFGSADNADHFPFLHAYSPYHNLRAGGTYPATLVTTADTDDRVVPMHSFKFAAALQHAQSGSAPVMIRIETRAGHGRGTPISKRIEQQADIFAFLEYATRGDQEE